MYVTWLDLAGFSNQFASVSNMVTSLLFAPSSIHIYYARSDMEANNSYLLDQTYLLAGGGLLLPAIPEPASLSLLIFAAMGAMLRRRQLG